MRHALMYLAHTCGISLMMIASMISNPMRMILSTIGALMAIISCAILCMEDNNGR